MDDRSEILIIDDDEDICEVVSVLLESEGFFTQQAHSGREALSLISSQLDLIILDITLPDGSGFSICEKIRRTTVAPILYLSAKALAEDKEMAFQCGGDDYLTKPFIPTELISRVRAMLRRYRVYQGKNARDDSQFIRIQNLLLNPDNGEVLLNGTRVGLRPKEYQLLMLLTQNRGTVFSIQTIYERLWCERYMPSANNTVMVHIRNLRQKIESDPQHPTYILTVWGEGYQSA